MSTKEKIGKGEVVGWTLELEWSNGVIEKHGECDDTCASEVDNYLTELEKERNEIRTDWNVRTIYWQHK